MDTFFFYLKKSLVGCIAVMFAFIVTYTPQDYTKEVHAGAVAGGSTWPGQVLQLGQQFLNKTANVMSSISASLIEMKEMKLDAVAWTALKLALVALADSVVDWANNGFRDGPTFVRDLEDFLRREADAVIGNYIESLGEVGSFLCDPFKPDIRLALELDNFVNRNTPARCTLSDVVDNIEDFTSGSQGSFSRGGGWEGWFEMVSNPGSNTAFGSLLTAQNQITELRLNKQSEETTKLGWGNGFFSINTCTEAGEMDTDGAECNVTTPGALISSAVNNNLDSNRQTLIEADEIGEAVAGFFGTISSGVFDGLLTNVTQSSGDGGAMSTANNTSEELYDPETGRAALLEEEREGFEADTAAEAETDEAQAEQDAQEAAVIDLIRDTVTDPIINAVGTSDDGSSDTAGDSAGTLNPPDGFDSWQDYINSLNVNLP
jgi:hypothetical protein